MHIKGKSIRAITKLLAAANGSKNIKLIQKLSEDDSIKIGFDSSPEVGDYLIPEPIGKITGLNAHGRVVVRKDLPKEPEPRSYYRTWEDWHGQEHSGIQTRYIDMYPREYIPAQEATLQIIEFGGQKYIATEGMHLTEGSDERNIHLANLMLECFGSFEILDVDSGNTVSTKVRQLHWDILPSGEYPWSRAKSLVGEITKKLKESDRGVVDDRMKDIAQFNPDFLATGRAGFSGYFVYGFSRKKYYVLESIHLDNATYVFGDNWELLSTLTKNQIINGGTEYKRIIHDKKWKREIRDLLVG